MGSSSNTKDETQKIRDVFSVLYSVIRVRGPKSALVFFSNDINLLTPLVHQLRCCDETDSTQWKKHYVLLYWISYLLLSPFDLATIQERGDDIVSSIYHAVLLYLPHQDSVGEVASNLLVRLITR